MKTLTPTKARKNITSLLTRAANGEDIGIIHPTTGQIIALRPVAVYSEDYALREYALDQKTLERAWRKTTAEIRQERATGKLREFDL